MCVFVAYHKGVLLQDTFTGAGNAFCLKAIFKNHDSEIRAKNNAPKIALKTLLKAEWKYILQRHGWRTIAMNPKTIAQVTSLGLLTETSIGVQKKMNLFCRLKTIKENVELITNCNRHNASNVLLVFACGSVIVSFVPCYAVYFCVLLFIYSYCSSLCENKNA